MLAIFYFSKKYNTNTNIKSGTTLFEVTNLDNTIKVTATWYEPLFFSSSKVEISVNESYKYQTEIANDGKNLSSDNYYYEWLENGKLLLTLIGEEQKDESLLIQMKGENIIFEKKTASSE